MSCFSGNVAQPFLSQNCRYKWHRMHPVSLGKFYRFSEYMKKKGFLSASYKDTDFVDWNLPQKEIDWYNNFIAAKY